MGLFRLATAAMVALGSPALAQGERFDLSNIALRYVKAQEAAMEADAGPAQADALIAFYSEDYVYHHPHFGAKVTGHDTLRQGITSNFGETANPQIEVKGILVNGNMVALAMEERFTTVKDKKEFKRPRMTILTFRDGRIVQRIDE